MTIEVQISKLIEALDRNTAASNQMFGLVSNNLKGLDATPGPATTEPSKPAATKPKAEKPKAEVKQVDPPKPEPAKTEAAPVVVESFDDFDAEPAGEATKALTVADARKALVALQSAKESAEASRGILKANGLASLAGLKDTDQEKIAKIIAECDAAIASVKK